MKILKIAGALICISLGIAKLIGLILILTDADQEQTVGWMMKQSGYAISFFILGIYLFIITKRRT